MFERDFGSWQWVLVGGFALVCLPALLVPAGMLLLVLLPIAVVAVPIASVAWLARS